TTAVLFFFDSIRKAALAAKEAIHLNIDSCDLMDRRHLHLVSETDTRIDLLIPPEAEAALLIICSAETPVDIRTKHRTLNEHLCLYNNWAFAENYSYDEHELEIYNLIRNSIQPTPNETRLVEPVSYVDDVTVNPHRLDEFLAELLVLMQSEEVSSSIYCHAPQGQMCLHPFLNLHEQADRDKLLSFASKYYELAWKYGGYIGREHGSGISRQYYLKQQSPEYYEVYRDIKLAFDPNNLFQPGKIISSDDSQPTLNLRVDYSKSTEEITEARKVLEVAQPSFISPKESKDNNSATDKTSASSEESEHSGQSKISPTNLPPEQEKLEDLTVLQMDWRQDQVFRDCFTCNDCGSCRSQDAGHRACPLFRQDLRETISPRAKANLIRAFALKQLELPELLSSEVKEIIDSCFNCRSCQFECSRHTPVPQMILQARSAYVSAMGLGFSDKLIAQFDKLSRMAIAFRPLASAVLKSPFWRMILEKTLGISSARKLPSIPSRSFLDEYSQFDIRYQDYNPESGVKRVFFFVSAFANYHDVALAEAVMRILQYNGIDVVCSVNQKPSGLSALTMGMRDKAAAIARHNVNILADAIRDSCDIVCVEPADTYCIKYEYPALLDRDPDARLVSENIYDLSQYLWALHLDGRLNLKFQSINMTIGYHAPCRLRALNIGYPTVNLLRLIPGLNVETIEAGCCGMAGLYGLQAKNYYNSIKIGMPLITQLRKPAIQASTTDCSSCRIAMEHKSTKPCIHPIKILACSYGIMPEIIETLRRPARDNVLT
ncbi:MAG: 4Fe-4S dicluster domain-containing protein, partial [Thermoguttaceae bacterium]|nr:4Fe-4S dicluster domain-containing protein [Thermoguttaceae bacterium]